MPRIEPPSASFRDAPSWPQLSTVWPGADTSEFWRVRNFVWHVQRTGAGPKILFLHGTGAASHSWAPLVDSLKATFETICIDLPGHGFTQAPRGFRPNLPNVSSAIAALCDEMGIAPDIVVGHSAGAAIAIRLATRHQFAPRLIASVNGALRPFDGMMKLIAPTTAKLAVLGGVAARMVSRNSTSDARVRRLVSDIGSDPDLVDTNCYAALLRTPGHVQGALKLMAHWDLTGVMEACRHLSMPILFMAGDQDRAVSSGVAREAAGHAPEGSYIEFKGLGHLAHEEAPLDVGSTISDAWRQVSA